MFHLLSAWIWSTAAPNQQPGGGVVRRVTARTTPYARTGQRSQRDQ
ncbi:MAG: hypothetical protein U0350_09245 [Caldilineaceae bacterium]